MKRFHWLLPALAALTLVSACGKDYPFTLPETNTDPEPVVPPDPTPEPEPEPDPIEIWGLKDLARACGLMIGTEFTFGEYGDDSLRVVLKRDFDAVTFGNEMKNDQIVSGTGEFNFTRADQMVGWAKDCELKLFGHTLGWHSQQQNDYLVNKLVAGAADADEAAALVRDFHKKWVDAMVGHFDVYGWDVVNEVFIDSGAWRNKANSQLSNNYHVFFWGDYYPGGPKEFVDTAFRTAREALEREGKSAILYINDYNLEGGWAHGKLEALCQYAEGNPDVTGVGSQMHTSGDLYSPSEMKNMLERMVKTGKKVRISELDVASGKKMSQADIILDVFKQYLDIVPEAQRGGITFWGVSDKNSWLGANKQPLLYNSQYLRKDAYLKLHAYLLERSGLNKK